jgi:arylsulfate sulfotransferase
LIPWLAACSRPQVGIETLEIVEGDALAPLSRAVHLVADRPVTLAATAGERTWVSPIPAEEHLLPLVGLGVDATVSVVVDGRAPQDLAVVVGDLPSPLPAIEVQARVPAAMAPGLTLVSLASEAGDACLVLLDDAGAIVWLYGPLDADFSEVRLVEGGLLGHQDGDLTAVSWMGEVVGRWSSELGTDGIAVPVPGFHHELLVTSRGTFATFTKAAIEIEAFHLSETDPTALGPTTVTTDDIVEIDPATGAIVDRWAMADVFDTSRIGFDSLSDGTYGPSWLHLNSAAEDGDRWIASARHQDAVVAFHKDNSEIDWILANPANWRPPFAAKRLTPLGSPFAWPYHPHAVHVDGDRILLLDNGNYRASPFTDEVPARPEASYSRVVEYAIDEAAGTVRQTWEHVPDPPLFSSAMGDADWLPNGNVLADYGFVQWIDHVATEDLGLGPHLVRLIEVVPATGEVVWEVQLAGPEGWHAYRAERIARPFGGNGD